MFGGVSVSVQGPMGRGAQVVGELPPTFGTHASRGGANWGVVLILAAPKRKSSVGRKPEWKVAPPMFVGWNIWAASPPQILCHSDDPRQSKSIFDASFGPLRSITGIVSFATGNVMLHFFLRRIYFNGKTNLHYFIWCGPYCVWSAL